MAPHTYIGSAKLVMGEKSFVNAGCILDTFEWIRIGARVHLGHGVRIITSSHQIGGSENRAGSMNAAPVVIEDGAWLGAACMVLPGVTIGAGCVIGAGALVTKDTEPNMLYIGIPARAVRALDV